MTILLRKYTVSAVITALFVLAFPAVARVATGTIMPTPFQVFLDVNGNPISGGKVCTYIAGTTTPTATYTDSALLVPNGNPIVTDVSGRFTAYLSPGASYKFIYQDNDGTANTCNGTVIKTVDNVSAVPASSANLDITGTAGEALTAGQAVYLSDGSGSKTAGQWFKADSANTYSSSAAVSVGMAPASILSAGSGTIRLAGSMTGLTSLTIGTTYYAGTAGALTSTQPTNSRVLGIADSTSSLVLAANPGIPNQDNSIEDFRLTLTTGTPVTTADVTAATTIYASPYKGNRIALFDSAGNATVRTSAEFSIAVPGTTSQMYDVFAYSNSGVPTLELLQWTNDTTRATAIVLTTTGTYTKSGDLTRRYLGSFRTTTVSGQTEDSITKHYVWNYYNRVRRLAQRLETTASWTYTTAALRQANGAAANQLDFVIGVAEVPLTVNLAVPFSNSAGGVNVTVGIAEDGVTPILSGVVGGQSSSAATIATQLFATVTKYPAVGRHIYTWVEFSAATGTTTWYGTITGQNSSGLSGFLEG